MRRLLLACIAATAFAGASAANAGVIPTGWTCTGNCGTDGADGDVPASPLNNSSYEYVSTNGGIGGVGANPQGGPGSTNGSLLTTSSFAAAAGTALTFYFNFITSDGGTFADNAWAALYKSDGTFVTELYSSTTGSTGYIPGLSHVSWLGNSSGECYEDGCGSTGWQEVNYTILSEDTYYVAFGTTNYSDTNFDTGLAIDGLAVGGQQIAPSDVPEPATLAVLGAGLASLGFAHRRRRRTGRRLTPVCANAGA